MGTHSLHIRLHLVIISLSFSWLDISIHKPVLFPIASQPIWAWWICAESLPHREIIAYAPATEPCFRSLIFLPEEATWGAMSEQPSLEASLSNQASSYPEWSPRSQSIQSLRDSPKLFYLQRGKMESQILMALSIYTVEKLQVWLKCQRKGLFKHQHYNPDHARINSFKKLFFFPFPCKVC